MCDQPDGTVGTFARESMTHVRTSTTQAKEEAAAARAARKAEKKKARKAASAAAIADQQHVDGTAAEGVGIPAPAVPATFPPHPAATLPRQGPIPVQLPSTATPTPLLVRPKALHGAPNAPPPPITRDAALLSHY